MLEEHKFFTGMFAFEERGLETERSRVTALAPGPTTTFGFRLVLMRAFEVNRDVVPEPGTRKNTRSTSQVRRRCTNSNSRPDHG